MTLTEHTKTFLASAPEVTFVRAEDIADAALYILGAPPNVQVNVHHFDLIKFTKRFNLFYFRYVS